MLLKPSSTHTARQLAPGCRGTLPAQACDSVISVFAPCCHKTCQHRLKLAAALQEALMKIGEHMSKQGQEGQGGQGGQSGGQQGAQGDQYDADDAGKKADEAGKK